MKIILCCFTLLLAIPASATSLETATCRASHLRVEQMADSEKLCRSFMRALAGLPKASVEQGQHLLTPENLSIMVATATVWLGSQSVPIVGQAVDAALIALGVVLLAVQVGDVTHAIWLYVNHSLGARSDSELDTAASHLSRVLAIVGLNVVAFVLMKKAAVERPRHPPQGSLQLATSEGVLSPVGVAPASTPISPSAVMTGIGRGPRGSSQVGSVTGRLTKVLNLKAFAAWVHRAQKQPVRGDSKALRFQREHGGSDEILAVGGGEQAWADGVNLLNGRLREIKFIEFPEKSPYIPGSSCNGEIRALIREQTFDQFRRYAAVVLDEATPVVGLEVITNDARAAPYFELLLKEVGFMGEVIVK